MSKNLSQSELGKLLWEEADKACTFLSEHPEQPVLDAMQSYCAEVNPDNSALARDWAISFLEEVRERTSRIKLGLTGYDPVFAGSEEATIVIRDMVRGDKTGSVDDVANRLRTRERSEDKR